MLSFYIKFPLYFNKNWLILINTTVKILVLINTTIKILV